MLIDGRFFFVRNTQWFTEFIDSPYALVPISCSFGIPGTVHLIRLGPNFVSAGNAVIFSPNARCSGVFRWATNNLRSN